MSKVGIFMADGCEEIEGLTVVDIVRRAKLEIETISITEKAEVTSSHQVTFKTDTTKAQADFDSYDAIVLPGGMPGTKYLGAYEPLCRLLEEKNSQGAYLAAICAAPSVLGDLGLLKGKKAICYPGFEERLTGADVTFEKVVTDGNITTSMGMGTAIVFALRLVELLCGADKAGEIKKSIRYGHLSEL